MRLTINDFHPIGKGVELQNFIIDHFGWPPISSEANIKIVGRNLQQTIGIPHDHSIDDEELLRVIKNYYKTKSPAINFYKGEIGSSPVMYFAEPKSDEHEYVFVTNDKDILLISIGSYLGSCPFRMEPLN